MIVTIVLGPDSRSIPGRRSESRPYTYQPAGDQRQEDGSQQ